MSEFSILVGNNIAKYRKLNNLTQLELAEKINFSDKSISKWERGDGVPDAEVLKQICDILGITLNDVVADEGEPVKPTIQANIKIRKTNHLAITLISALSVWVVATIVFVCLLLVGQGQYAWLSFIFAIPSFFVVLLVFSCLWGKRYLIYILISCVLWTTIIAICIPTGAWELIYIAIPLQVVELLCYFIKLPRSYKNIQKEVKKPKQTDDLDTKQT